MAGQPVAVCLAVLLAAVSLAIVSLPAVDAAASPSTAARSAVCMPGSVQAAARVHAGGRTGAVSARNCARTLSFRKVVRAFYRELSVEEIHRLSGDVRFSLRGGYFVVRLHNANPDLIVTSVTIEVQSRGGREIHFREATIGPDATSRLLFDVDRDMGDLTWRILGGEGY